MQYLHVRCILFEDSNSSTIDLNGSGCFNNAAHIKVQITMWSMMKMYINFIELIFAFLCKLNSFLNLCNGKIQ